MLGVLCTRSKPWILSSLSVSLAHGSAAHIHKRAIQSDSFRSFVAGGHCDIKRNHSTSCQIASFDHGGAASVWHAILPAGNGALHRRRRWVFYHQDEIMKRGEGSWNVAWDARPARWLRNPDTAWLLFGVCACLSAPAPLPALWDSSDIVAEDSNAACEKFDGYETKIDKIGLDGWDESSPPNFKVTGVTPDGRCLFRAIAHVACLRRGGEVPDDSRQGELADELRAQVVDELLRRRKEAEWFIEGDFDEYVKGIEKPYIWGGEPELLMSSHVLQTPISVFMIDRRSANVTNIANYGEEYMKDEQKPINVLFHGYGHYDILDFVPEDLES